MDCDVRESVIFRLNSLRHLVVRCADIANIPPENPPEVNLCLQRVVSIVSDDSQYTDSRKNRKLHASEA